ncbi:MAG TPA: hypothetical protein VFS20_15875 [Longimicrobium sp.]|nr:hypothetical protein [Longimicrobium sp.]
MVQPLDPPIVVTGGDESVQPPLPIAGGTLPYEPIADTDSAPQSDPPIVISGGKT